jgi:hypothetical protein
MKIVNCKLKILSKGITLIEIIIVIFLIVLFSTILISDFPKIQMQFALSRATHKLAQDLRRVQDLGLSGVQIKDSLGNPITVKGYGVYVNPVQDGQKYVIYADVTDSNGVVDHKFIGQYNNNFCSDKTNPTADCVIEIIDISQENPNLYIKNQIISVSTYYTSINFSPPNPIINIDNINMDASEIGIVFGLTGDISAVRTVWVTTSGLINVQQYGEESAPSDVHNGTAQ